MLYDEFLVNVRNTSLYAWKNKVVQLDSSDDDAEDVSTMPRQTDVSTSASSDFPRVCYRWKLTQCEFSAQDLSDLLWLTEADVQLFFKDYVLKVALLQPNGELCGPTIAVFDEMNTGMMAIRFWEEDISFYDWMLATDVDDSMARTTFLVWIEDSTNFLGFMHLTVEFKTADSGRSSFPICWMTGVRFLNHDVTHHTLTFLAESRFEIEANVFQRNYKDSEEMLSRRQKTDYVTDRSDQLFGGYGNPSESWQKTKDAAAGSTRTTWVKCHESTEDLTSVERETDDTFDIMTLPP
eukprot:s4346_g2.t1